MELEVRELPAVVGGCCQARAGARTLGQGGCWQDAPVLSSRCLCGQGEGLRFAFFLPHVQSKYLLNFFSLFPA